MVGVQESIDVAASATAATLAAPMAGEQFRREYKGSYKVRAILDKATQRNVQRLCDVPIIFEPTYTVLHDHPVLAALREVIRAVYEDRARVFDSVTKMLVIGAAEREMSHYNSLEAVHFYLGLCDSKDMTRIVMSCLSDIAKRLDAQAKKRETRLRRRGGASIPSVRKRYMDIQEILRDRHMFETGDMDIAGVCERMRYHVDIVEANTLLFEDSFYNFEVADYMAMFDKSGAVCGYGYGMLPLELIFPEMPANPYYVLHDGPLAGQKAMTYRGGYTNGYCHYHSAWSTLLRHKVMYGKPHGKDFDLVVEINARAGPLAVFTIIRRHAWVSKVPEVIVSSVSIPKSMEYVRLLDIPASIDFDTGARKELKYFSVFADEYYKLLTYLCTLAVGSLSVPAALSFIRRRAGGISLATKELEPSWHLEQCDFHRVALAGTIHAQLLSGYTEIWMDKFKEGATVMSALRDWVTTSRKQVVSSFMTALSIPQWLCYGWLLKEDLLEKICLEVDPEVLQTYVLEARHRSEPHGHIDFHPILPASDAPDCPICFALEGNLGRQILKCEHKEVTVKMQLSTEQLAEMAVALRSDDVDPAYRDMFKRVLPNLPKCGFEHHVKMYYFEGGPGTGKSYIIRKLATGYDLIYAPFNKLASDYMNVEQPDGSVIDLTFKTTHRGLETRGCRRIFVDEFQAVPYEYLQVVAYLNGAEEIYLMGDINQTGIRETAAEGMYIGNHVDMGSLSKHTLLVNFRNPAPIVALLNKSYGYAMQADKTDVGIVVHCKANELPEFSESVLYMAFSDATCEVYEIPGSTVRSNQGQTTGITVLYIGAGCSRHIREAKLARVAISRHTKALYLVTDDTPEAVAFAESIVATQSDYTPYLKTYTPAQEHVERENTPAVNKWLCEVGDNVSSNSSSTYVSSIDDESTTDSVSTYVSPWATGVLEFFSPLGAVGLRLFQGRKGISLNMGRPHSISEGDDDCATPSTISTVCKGKHKEGPCHLGCSSVVLTGTSIVDFEAQGPITPKSNSSTEYEDAFMSYVPSTRVTTSTFKFVEAPDLPQSKLVAPYGTLDLGYSLFPSTALAEQTSANLVSSAVVPANFRGGVLASDLFTQLNPRRNPKKVVSRYRSFVSGNGLHFGPEKPMQTVQVLGGRYLNKKKHHPFNEQAILLARSVARKFVSECMDIKPMDESTMQVLLTEFEAAAEHKHYEAQFGGFDDPNSKTVRFHLKEIYKPKVGEPDLFKPGQGVAAWSKTAQVYFGAPVRILNYHFKSCLKPNVLFDNRETETSFAAAMEAAFRKIPDVAKFAQGDWTMMDSVQNEFTQEIERQIFLAMGVNEQFLDHYYMFRKNYKIDAGVVYGLGGTEKTSGEPGTLLMNTMLSGAITLWILKWQGPFALVMKGDDTILKACETVVDQDALKALETYFDLGFRMEIGDSADFCGNALVEGTVAPNILRKWYKVAAHRFRSYEHFTEFQISLRDWDKQLSSRVDLNRVYGINSVLVGKTVDEIRLAHMCIRSVSHIDKDQFFRYFPEREEYATIPTADGLVVSSE